MKKKRGRSSVIDIDKILNIKKKTKIIKVKKGKKSSKKETKKKKFSVVKRHLRRIGKKEGMSSVKTNYTEKTTKTSGKISSGLANFDKLVEGGFEKNSANVVVGASGSGKTIFATHFLVDGMKKGEPALYITFEEKKEQFYKNMKQFGWDLEEYEKKKLFSFLEYTPGKVKTMLEEGGGAIETTILRQHTSRIVIDSITSFALLFDNELEKREAALTLFNMISSWNCTSVLTLEEDPMISKEFTTAKTIEFESDSITLLYYLLQKGERKRYLEVLKMRGVKHSRKVYEFEITPSGIKVLSKNLKKIEGL